MTDSETIIARLRGVISVRVVADHSGDISEIHVVADQSRSPKQLSRDIESVLLSELGLRIDHRKVSIAQLRDDGEPTPDLRLKFLGIDYSVDRNGARARVSLSRGEDTFTGVASSQVGPNLKQEELVARAAVAAIEEFLRSAAAGNGSPTLELGDFTRANGGEHAFVMVMVRILGRGGEENLLGSALERDDPWRAATSAVLDAVNRRLGALTG
jgi:hypothetical protein